MHDRARGDAKVALVKQGPLSALLVALYPPRLLLQFHQTVPLAIHRPRRPVLWVLAGGGHDFVDVVLVEGGPSDCELCFVGIE